LILCVCFETCAGFPIPIIVFLSILSHDLRKSKGIWTNLCLCLRRWCYLVQRQRDAGNNALVWRFPRLWN
jgi:hypothetical protein